MEHYNFIIFFLFSFIINIFPQNYPDKNIDSLIRCGVNSVLIQDYDSAFKTFTYLDSAYKDIPLGKIYLAGFSIVHSIDFSEPFDNYYINKLLDDSKEQSEKLLKEKDDIWNQYFLALSYGYCAYFQALNEKWLPAFSNGLSSLNEFELCVKEDPYFYEAYIAIGSYKYWRSRKTDALNWLPFVSDEKDKGVSILEAAIDKNCYNSYLAIYSLIWIYIDQGRFEDAAALAEKALNKYKGSRFFMIPLARCYEEIDTKKSIEIYKNVLDSYTGIKNRINEITIKHKMASQYYKLKNYQKSLDLCDEVLAIKNLSQYETNTLEKRLQKVKELQQKNLDSLGQNH